MKLRPKQYHLIDFDSVEASRLAQQAISEKKCLRSIYQDMYQMIMNARKKYLTTGGKVLEIGSGGGFVKTLYPQVITSDVRQLAQVDMVFSAESLPFEDNSLDAIIAIFVLHHIPDINRFFAEAKRVLKKGGGIIAVETYYSPLARFIYKNIHPEPFDEHALDWKISGNTPMTSSNQALSYLLLKRDKKLFEKQFPDFHLVYQKPFGFMRYILTGGLWLEQKCPDWIFPVLKAIERMLSPFMVFIGLHHIFVLKKQA